MAIAASAVDYWVDCYYLKLDDWVDYCYFSKQTTATIVDGLLLQ